MANRLRRWVQRIAREAVQDELVPHAASVQASVQASVHASLEATEHRVLEALETSSRSVDARADQRDEHLAGAVHALAEAIGRLGTHLDDQHAFLHTLTERTDLLMREVVLAGLARGGEADLIDARPTVLGGTLGPDGAVPPTAIDLRNDWEPGALVQVWSHFQGVWASGFRFVGFVNEAHGRTVRVARISDRYELPIRFAAHEVRLASERGSGPPTPAGMRTVNAVVPAASVEAPTD